MENKEIKKLFAVEKKLSPLQEFKEKLIGWMTNPDGEDFCPEHWEEYLRVFKDNQELDDEDVSRVIKNSLPTSKVAKYRKSSDGWYVSCEKNGCKNNVFVPF